MRGQSDLDLILIVETSLEPRIGMDLLVYTPAEFETMKDRPFLRHALRDATVIYEA